MRLVPTSLYLHVRIMVRVGVYRLQLALTALTLPFQKNTRSPLGCSRVYSQLKVQLGLVGLGKVLEG